MEPMSHEGPQHDHPDGHTSKIHLLPRAGARVPAARARRGTTPRQRQPADGTRDRVPLDAGNAARMASEVAEEVAAGHAGAQIGAAIGSVLLCLYLLYLLGAFN